MCSSPSCQGVVEEIIIVNDTDAWFSFIDLVRKNRTLMMVVVGRFVTYCVMMNVRESVLVDRYTPFLPNKDDSSCTVRGKSGLTKHNLLISYLKLTWLRGSCSFYTISSEYLAFVTLYYVKDNITMRY